MHVYCLRLHDYLLGVIWLGCTNCPIRAGLHNLSTFSMLNLYRVLNDAWKTDAKFLHWALMKTVIWSSKVLQRWNVKSMSRTFTLPFIEQWNGSKPQMSNSSVLFRLYKSYLCPKSKLWYICRRIQNLSKAWQITSRSFVDSFFHQ